MAFQRFVMKQFMKEICLSRSSCRHISARTTVDKHSSVLKPVISIFAKVNKVQECHHLPKKYSTPSKEGFQCHNFHSSAGVAGWGSSSYQSGSNEEDSCKCGEPLENLRVMTVRKEGPNTGRQFYSCNACGFFKWKEGESATKSSVNSTMRQEQRRISGYATPSNGSRSNDIDQVITIQGNKIDELTKHVQLLRYQLAVVQGIVTNDNNLEENITGYISEMSESIQKENSDISESIQMEEKKCQVMIWNLPESDSDEIENDLEMVMEVLKSVDSSVDAASIVNELSVTRLGKTKPDSGSKPRPIKLVLPDELIKAKYLKNSMSLKTHDIFAQWSVFMSPDRTQKQMEQRMEKYSAKKVSESEE